MREAQQLNQLKERGGEGGREGGEWMEGGRREGRRERDGGRQLERKGAEKAE